MKSLFLLIAVLSLAASAQASDIGLHDDLPATDLPEGTLIVPTSPLRLQAGRVYSIGEFHRGGRIFCSVHFWDDQRKDIWGVHPNWLDMTPSMSLAFSKIRLVQKRGGEKALVLDLDDRERISGIKCSTSGNHLVLGQIRAAFGWGIRFVDPAGAHDHHRDQWPSFSL